jgi:hypothetical protein
MAKKAKKPTFDAEMKALVKSVILLTDEQDWK